ncbi:hypothetical protein K458DRAFT_482719 [Lentithecium fluviatile CBS 122367]|uniref:Uncharacterized protein n=1 Tax=Lentithecium fluviatile CBS 122367 TaxID=1168545 RepID=A0A6G1JPP5_9PLEO|nr:hypothetical protein K458DRAFT_482719 [Lentithecium fluviatile CBS 122367]
MSHFWGDPDAVQQLGYPKESMTDGELNSLGLKLVIQQALQTNTDLGNTTLNSTEVEAIQKFVATLSTAQNADAVALYFNILLDTWSELVDGKLMRAQLQALSDIERRAGRIIREINHLGRRATYLLEAHRGEALASQQAEDQELESETGERDVIGEETRHSNREPAQQDEMRYDGMDPFVRNMTTDDSWLDGKMTSPNGQVGFATVISDRSAARGKEKGARTSWLGRRTTYKTHGRTTPGTTDRPAYKTVGSTMLDGGGKGDGVPPTLHCDVEPEAEVHPNKPTLTTAFPRFERMSNLPKTKGFTIRLWPPG